jgi:phosphoglycerate dehydrogenase-like enzyme
MALTSGCGDLYRSQLSHRTVPHPTTSAGPTMASERPFHELGNVLMTPHVSGWTEGMLDARAALIAENIARIARGETPLNPVEPLH